MSLVCVSHAQQSQSNKIKVVTEYLEPYQTQSPSGELGGYATELVELLFSKTEDTPNFLVTSWARAYQTAIVEPNVLIFSIAKTPAREPIFQWVGAVDNERLFFWSLKHKFPASIADASLLDPYIISVSRHSNAEQYLKAHHFSNIKSVVREDQNMKLLFQDRVDLIIGTEVIFRARAEKLGLDFSQLAKVMEIKPLNNELSIAFGPNTELEIVEKYRAAYAQIERSGELQKLKAKWQIL